MENSNSKIVTLSFLIGSLLVGFTIHVLLEHLAGVASGGFGRSLSSDLVRHGVPVAIGTALFLLLQFNKNIATWADETVAEIRRVVWQSPKTTFQMTIVVCVMVLISGAILGLMDVASGTFIEWLVHLDYSKLF